MDDPAERMLNYRLKWQALLSWTLIIFAFSLVCLASIALPR
jgi:hypothetical protein